VVIDKQSEGYDYIKISLNDKELGCTYAGKKFGTLTFAAPGVQGNVIPGEFNTVEIYGHDDNYYDYYKEIDGEGGIVIIYRE
jgi:hypothetical protein